MQAPKITDNFDFEIGNDGMIAIAYDANAAADMLLLDFSSNSNWHLDERLGLPWVTESNTGYLQKKGQYNNMLSGISRKILDNKYVAELIKIEIVEFVNRDISVVAEAKLVNGSTIKLKI